jgi:hypothetical protein
MQTRLRSKLPVLAAQKGLILAPVELEGPTRTQLSQDKSGAAYRLLLSRAICAPLPGEGRHAIVWLTISWFIRCLD